MGGVLACQNNGVCGTNGNCQCTSGYTGNQCQTCKCQLTFFKSFYNVFFKNILIFKSLVATLVDHFHA